MQNVLWIVCNSLRSFNANLTTEITVSKLYQGQFRSTETKSDLCSLATP